MKSTFVLILLLFTNFSIHAQAPNKISYQAIVRDGDNNLLVNETVGLKIIIRQGTVNGSSSYEEVHSVDTNANGLVSLEIGTGSNTVGNFSEIPWVNGPYFVETQLDPAGGANYAIIGVSELLSVPYALHAKTAEKLSGNISGSTASKAEIISFTTSRSINASDISNTIACTANATLTLSSNFSDMEIGDTINLEAHNGAELIIQASSGVTINYNVGGSAKFESDTGNVRFGLLRKSGANAYIISGQ